MRVSWGVMGPIQPLAFIPGASPDPVFFFLADADYYFFNYNELVRFPSGPFASHDHFLGQLDKQFLSRGTEEDRARVELAECPQYTVEVFVLSPYFELYLKFHDRGVASAFEDRLAPALLGSQCARPPQAFDSEVVGNTAGSCWTLESSSCLRHYFLLGLRVLVMSASHRKLLMLRITMGPGPPVAVGSFSFFGSPEQCLPIRMLALDVVLQLLLLNSSFQAPMFLIHWIPGQVPDDDRGEEVLAKLIGVGYAQQRRTPIPAATSLWTALAQVPLHRAGCDGRILQGIRRLDPAWSFCYILLAQLEREAGHADLMIVVFVFIPRRFISSLGSASLVRCGALALTLPNLPSRDPNRGNALLTDSARARVLQMYELPLVSAWGATAVTCCPRGQIPGRWSTSRGELDNTSIMRDWFRFIATSYLLNNE
ncbi:hypothetical protein B0H17DRAFT_1177002 [Mycena rosella]|uniref:Uncharacterized protein n=1 Tax=Mycena rosella TaxID=1033263 RepID=A0AAD7DVW0_MYCRO|nr:hypothetical protein B0H17DRAFT_1177002 [Mycena rosella]